MQTLKTLSVYYSGSFVLLYSMVEVFVLKIEFNGNFQHGGGVADLSLSSPLIVSAAFLCRKSSRKKVASSKVSVTLEN